MTCPVSRSQLPDPTAAFSASVKGAFSRNNRATPPLVSRHGKSPCRLYALMYGEPRRCTDSAAFHAGMRDGGGDGRGDGDRAAGRADPGTAGRRSARPRAAVRPDGAPIVGW
ncbi:hypothetical protein [Kitasatospora aureofaciens]|uniref:hypothetical protein n=1 Tax=Kitasatospora aureofaciens TaxID=1894 RepID=UPI0004BF5AC2